MLVTVSEEYLQAYAKGFAAGLAAGSGEGARPYLRVEDVQARYGGIAKGKAYDIMNAVRLHCGGGKLCHNEMILLSEMEYWEGKVDKTVLERLGYHGNKR